MEINFRRLLNVVIVGLAFSASSSFAQEEKGIAWRQMSRDSILTAARTIIQESTCKVFITVDENGKPHAREMSPFSPDENWVIWLGTTPGSRKTIQIQNNPNVIVYYYDPKGMSYVSVAGKARLVNDPDKKAKYWIDGWRRYYPDREKNYILIEVTPENMEVCSFTYKMFWDSKGVPQSVDFVTDESKGKK